MTEHHGGADYSMEELLILYKPEVAVKIAYNMGRRHERERWQARVQEIFGKRK